MWKGKCVSNKPGMSDGGSPSLRSEGSSAPPVAQAATNSAQSLAAAHPLWQRAAGRGAPPTQRGGAGRGGGGGSQNGGARFEPLSALALEYGGFRNNADGDSALFSEEGESVARAPRGSGKRRVEEEEDDDEGGFSALAGSEDDSDEERERRKKKAPKSRGEAPASADAAMYAQAAFGGAYAASDGGESVSQMSGTSEARRKAAYKAAFPIKGVDCVGCMLVKQIAPVEKFVKMHFEKMAEDALWKQAALVYVREVQEPRKREGVLTPGWSWKDLRTHYLLHCSDHTISRTFACRQLQTMRYAVEQRMMRVDGDDRELDKGACDLMLKVRQRHTVTVPIHLLSHLLPSFALQIIKEESAQRSILQGMSNGPGRKGAGSSTVGDAK